MFQSKKKCSCFNLVKMFWFTVYIFFSLRNFSHLPNNKEIYLQTGPKKQFCIVCTNIFNIYIYIKWPEFLLTLKVQPFFINFIKQNDSRIKYFYTALIALTFWVTIKICCAFDKKSMWMSFIIIVFSRDSIELLSLKRTVMDINFA